MAHLRFNSLMAGNHNFIVGSNVTNFFAVGDFMKQDDFYSIGYFRNDGSFVIDAKLYASNGDLIASVKDMKVDLKGNLQQLNTVDKGDFHSLEVIDKNGIRVLYAETRDMKIPMGVGKIKAVHVVEINGEFYDKTNQLIATGTKDGLVIHRGKFVIGAMKSGSLGFVSCSQDESDFIRKFVQEHLP